jgi:hypothetical protein
VVAVIKWIAILMMLPVCGWGQAMQFNRASSNCVVVLHSLSNYASAFNTGASISAWIISQTNAVYDLTSSLNDGSTTGYHLRINSFDGSTVSNGCVRLFLRGQSSANYIASRFSTVINDGKWHHIVANYNQSASALAFYVDGVEIAGVIDAGGIGAQPLTTFQYFVPIGAFMRQGATINFAQAVVGSISFYTNTLTSSEVIALANAYPRVEAVNRGLIARYSYVNGQSSATIGQGQIIYDISGNAKHGFVTNGLTSTASIIGNRRTK